MTLSFGLHENSPKWGEQIQPRVSAQTLCKVASVVSVLGQPTRLLCPWGSPGKNIGVGCHFLLQQTLYVPQK